MLRKIFRHNSSFLLLLGMITAFVAFINGTDIYMAYQNAGKESESYNYKYSYFVEVCNFDGSIEFKEDIKKLPGNIDFGNDVLQVGRDSIHDSDILYTCHESLPFEVDIIDKDGELYIGDDLKKYCVKKDGSLFLNISGKNIPVAGILKSKTYEVLAYKLYLLPNCRINDGVIFSSDYLAFYYFSNEKNPYDYLKELSDKYSDKYLITYYDASLEDGESGLKNETKHVIYFILLAFSMITCIVMSEFWIMRRKNEIYIRSLFGCSNFKIFINLYKQMFQISLFAGAITLILQLIFSKFGIIRTDFSILKLLISFIFTITSSFIVVLLPVKIASGFSIEKNLEIY